MSDIHRILIQGGVFLYPGNSLKPEGKFRFLYESAPLAFIVKKARRKATTEHVGILDVLPAKLHERTP